MANSNVVSARDAIIEEFKSSWQDTFIYNITKHPSAKYIIIWHGSVKDSHFDLNDNFLVAGPRYNFQTKDFFTPKDRISFMQRKYNIKPIWYDFEKIIRDFFDEHEDIDIPKSSKINNPVGIFPYFLKDKALSISVSNIF
jgi:hypothetical protein